MNQHLLQSGKQAGLCVRTFVSGEATCLSSRRLSKEASCSKPKRTLLLLSQPVVFVPCCIRATHASAPLMSIRVSALQNCPIASAMLSKQLLVQGIAGTRYSQVFESRAAYVGCDRGLCYRDTQANQLNICIQVQVPSSNVATAWTADLLLTITCSSQGIFKASRCHFLPGCHCCHNCTMTIKKFFGSLSAAYVDDRTSSILDAP